MRDRFFWGVIFIVVGTLIWLSNWGVFYFSWRRDWPIILIVIGIHKLITLISRKKKGEPQKDIMNILERIERCEITAEEGVKEIVR